MRSPGNSCFYLITIVSITQNKFGKTSLDQAKTFKNVYTVDPH